ncbi:MAG: glycosyltransferase [Bacteroidota bacterium]|nr:glycosyltransferase [Bacteroidota bacterium]
MKICFVSTFYPYRGGIAQFNANLYRALEKKDHELRVINFKRQYPDVLFPGKSQYVPENDSPEAIDNERILDSINPFNWMKTARRVRKINPRLLIMRFWMPFFGPSLGYVAGKMKKRARRIAILDNVIPHEKRFFDIPLIRYFLKRTDAYVVMSRSVEKELIRLKPKARYIFHPHPLYDHFGTLMDKTKARGKLNISQDKKTLLFFGFIREYKGLDLLIDAFGKLDDSYQLIIAGDCYGSFDKYQKQIDANKNNDNIHKFVRYIPDDEVPLFFSAADVSVLPYKSATQSGITSISYHFKIPMLTTDVGGLKEVVKDGVTGKIATEVKAENIAAIILDYFKENKAETYKQNIRDLKKYMSWESLADSILDMAGDID